jgi:hypothetical protein
MSFFNVLLHVCQEGRNRGEDKSMEDIDQSSKSSNEGNGASSRNEYQFTDGEAQLLRICIDAMHTAGLALNVQGISTGLLGELAESAA